jgi:hypothetical protein
MLLKEESLYRPERTIPSKGKTNSGKKNFKINKN